jgi:hypothetical protein
MGRYSLAPQYGFNQRSEQRPEDREGARVGNGSGFYLRIL